MKPLCKQQIWGNASNKPFKCKWENKDYYAIVQAFNVQDSGRKKIGLKRLQKLENVNAGKNENNRHIH